MSFVENPTSVSDQDPTLGPLDSSSIPDGVAFLQNIYQLNSQFKSKTLFHSFRYAIEGILYAFETQRNVRIHIGLALVAIIMGAVLHIGLLEWALLFGLIGVVLAAEMINTVLELVVDLVMQGRYDQRAKAIKDTAAGAVLVTAFCAFIGGSCIFVPRLMMMLHI